MNRPSDDKARKRLPIVGIGASAGGLEALRDMLAAVGSPTGMAFVIVQHLDPNHESMLAQLLDRHTNMAVQQASGGEVIEADNVYIIPPGRGLAIRDGVLQLTDFEQPRGLRRPIDDFFISLATDQQANAACVILSGTGADGTTGLRAIKEHGGVSVVQTPESARYDGMPLSAVGTGLVDFVKPPAEILECLAGFFARRAQPESKRNAALVADHVDDLCKVLRNAIGHDFAGYKRSTVIRRVERRMQVLGIEGGFDYLKRVREDRSECQALFRDLLINVTRFFRDPDIFETLRTKVVEPLLEENGGEGELRVWIPGCSSGEEAYSLAMLFAECARKRGEPLSLQVFATDIDDSMLDIAREGSYPAAALTDIPMPMRERYTVPHGERFTIASSIRDMIRFSAHSLVRDPPFSKIDLVSCRNLLIYFDERLQGSIMPLLHYAIRSEGYLLLGPSESVGRFDHLFPAIDPQARIFRRSPGAPSYPIDLPGRSVLEENRRRRSGDGGEAAPRIEESAAARRILDRYAPPSLLLDQDGSIVAAYGKLSPYFEFPVTRSGGSSAIALARPGLRNVIGPLLREARQTRKRMGSRDVEVSTGHGMQKVDVICDPMSDGTLLFIFRDSAPFVPRTDDDFTDLDESEDRLDVLEDELRTTRHRLRSVVEELETANEELKSSNEEMMSMNEELQSTNEELTTVNDELNSKVEQLTVANADLRNFYDSTELAVVVLDAKLRVRNYTEAATAIFPLKPTDRGRPLHEVASRLASEDYLDDARAIVEGKAAIRRRIVSRDGQQTWAMRAMPYRALNGQVDGATLVLTDITGALEMESDLASERERLDMALKAAGIGVWEYDVDTGETIRDATEIRLLGLNPEEGTHVDSFLARVHPEDRKGVEEALRAATSGDGDFEARYRVVHANGEIHTMKGLGRLIARKEGRRLVGVTIDVTADYRLAEQRELMIREMNHRVKNLFAIIGSMLSIGARKYQDLKVYADDMRTRIAALGRAHSLVATGSEVQDIGLHALVETAIDPYRGETVIEIEGPATLIRHNCLSPLALMLHEWATNSVKYGALGSEGGTLTVKWSRRPDGVALNWTERSKRAPANPSKEGKGFGTVLVETASRQLNTKVFRKSPASGFVLDVLLPLDVLVDGRN